MTPKTFTTTSKRKTTTTTIATFFLFGLNFSVFKIRTKKKLYGTWLDSFSKGKHVTENLKAREFRFTVS